MLAQHPVIATLHHILSQRVRSSTHERGLKVSPPAKKKGPYEVISGLYKCL
jgi:hypothetical protein